MPPMALQAADTVDAGGVEEVARHEHELRGGLAHKGAYLLDRVDARLLYERPLVRVTDSGEGLAYLPVRCVDEPHAPPAEPDCRTVIV
jgi:hypothetical protein